MDDPDHWRLATECSAPGVASAPTQRQPRRIALLCLALDGPGPSAEPYEREPSQALQNAVLAALTRVAGSAGTVIQLDAGTFACLVRDPPSRESLSLCSWALLDAVSALALNGKTSSSWRVAIGISIGRIRDARYAALLRNADAAMHRARRQRSGFAFFDDRVDVWELETSQMEAPGV